MSYYGQKSDEEMNNQKSFFKRLAFFGVLNVMIIITLSAGWGPVMRPWIQERTGMANLARETYNTQIRREAAMAERDAAQLRAQAIAIVGEVAREYPEFRTQELMGGFGLALERGTIPMRLYVPTENGLPIMPGVQALPITGEME